MKFTQTLATLSAMPLLAYAGLRGDSEQAGGQGNRPNADGSCGPRNNPVCSGDGEVTYQNPCLAEAQGETDYTNGPCAGNDVTFRGDGAVTAAEMGRFKDENFKLVGKVENWGRGGAPLVGEELDGDDLPDTDAPGQMKRLTRVTPDGFKYVTKDHTPGAPFDTNPASQGNDRVPAALPGFEGDADEDDFGGRKLQIGTDTRSKISSTSVYPYWRLGEVDWAGGEGGCSGSIVGTNKVLLAAHCVYDTYRNQWQVPSAFAPGRYRDCPWWMLGFCRTVEPWGTWPVQTATIATAWIDHAPGGPGLVGISAGGVGVDVAIMTMGTNWAGNIGTYMGTLPIIDSPCAINSGSTTTGYPASKPDGEMWTSGQCEFWGSGCSSNRVIWNTCDISPGHSGSAVYDNNKRVFGVVSAGGSSSSYFFGFSSAWRNSVLTW